MIVLTNGVVHFIDKVLAPKKMQQTSSTSYVSTEILLLQTYIALSELMIIMAEKIFIIDLNLVSMKPNRFN